ncbi:TetR/AcrR family transcriptional regulator [Brevundimonas faecalis]|uniref:AcrR family transcriptional regulator n=1 Tax=Brevundimonas faecalis TaxID=947378 RepID=A0ABV2RDH8_9CAUL
MTTTIAASRSIDADRIVAAAMALVAEVGLGGLTMRDLAQSVGKSTTVIVNLFGAKAGLIEAMAGAAYEQDEAYHQAFFAQADSLELSRDGLLALCGRYLRERAMPSAGFVRMWEELLVSHAPDPFLPPLMARWEAMRAQSWTRLLSRTPDFAAFGAPLSTYLVMEQFYVGALGGRADYEMIAAEGLGGLIDRAFGRPDDEAPVTESYVDRMAVPKAPGDDLDADSMKLRLLDLAANQILTHGVAALTNRSVSTEAGVSTSTLAYHWADMRRFIVDSVWHAVFREMPRHLDFRRPADGGRPDLAGWSERMAGTLTLDGAGGPGFYVKYARLIAQICLKARRDSSFQELAMILRGPEGGGTYVTREERWPPQFDLTRRAAARFAIWIKGAALTGAATGATPAASQLGDAATTLVALAVREPNTRS